jgi:predicted XRE-type DNA-binding protein
MTNITRGTNNIFADIGVPDAETHLLKAELVQRIGALIKAGGLTQAQASERMDMSQPDLSKMLGGRFRPISIERLLRCLVALGQSVTIDVGPPKGKAGRPTIEVMPVR